MRYLVKTLALFLFSFCLVNTLKKTKQYLIREGDIASNLVGCWENVESWTDSDNVKHTVTIVYNFSADKKFGFLKYHAAEEAHTASSAIEESMSGNYKVAGETVHLTQSEEEGGGKYEIKLSSVTANSINFYGKEYVRCNGD